MNDTQESPRKYDAHRLALSKEFLVQGQPGPEIVAPPGMFFLHLTHENAHELYEMLRTALFGYRA